MKTKPWAISLIIFVTFCTSFAQVFFKWGSQELSPFFFFNSYIIIGGILYVVGAVFLIISFKGGDVSVLYPIVATSYAWVVLLSYFFFDESIGFLKLSGVLLIIIGIIGISQGSKDSVMQYEEPL